MTEFKNFTKLVVGAYVGYKAFKITVNVLDNVL